jgi:hypothetical protein
VGESAQTPLVSHCASVVVYVLKRTCAAGCMFGHEEPRQQRAVYFDIAVDTAVVVYETEFSNRFMKNASSRQLQLSRKYR